MLLKFAGVYIHVEVPTSVLTEGRKVPTDIFSFCSFPTRVRGCIVPRATSGNPLGQPSKYLVLSRHCYCHKVHNHAVARRRDLFSASTVYAWHVRRFDQAYSVNMLIRSAMRRTTRPQPPYLGCGQGTVATHSLKRIVPDVFFMSSR